MSRPTREGEDRGLRNRGEGGRKVVEEVALLNVDAQELGQLVEHDDDSDPRLESDEHRIGDEVRDESQTEERGGGE